MEIHQSFNHKDYEFESEFILDDGRKVGFGPGFKGDELLSKDELNVILDLEDEGHRQG